MYINGDILVSPFIINFFVKYKYKLKDKRIYITCDRHNIYINHSQFIKINAHNEIYKCGKQYTKCGQDVFITTKRTFNEDQMIIIKNIAIGRIGIDNIILGMALKDKRIITLDISDIIQATHIQYSKQISKNRIKKVDYHWNYNIIKSFSRKLIGFACLDKIHCIYNSTTLHFVGNINCASLNY